MILSKSIAQSIHPMKSNKNDLLHEFCRELLYSHSAEVPFQLNDRAKILKSYLQVTNRKQVLRWWWFWIQGVIYFLKGISLYTLFGLERKYSLTELMSEMSVVKLQIWRWQFSTYHWQWESAEHHFLGLICFHRDVSVENILSPMWCRYNFWDSVFKAVAWNKDHGSLKDQNTLLE